MYPSAGQGVGEPPGRSPSDATAITAAIFAVGVGLLALVRIVLDLDAFNELAATVGFDNAVQITNYFGPYWWTQLLAGGQLNYAITAVLLLCGAVLLLRRRLAGRTMIIFGSLAAIGGYLVGWVVVQSAVGSWRISFDGLTGGSFSSGLESAWPPARTAGVRSLGLPVIVLLLAAAPSTRRWCLYRGVGHAVVMPPPPAPTDPPVPGRAGWIPPVDLHKQPSPKPASAPRVPLTAQLADIPQADRIRDGAAVTLYLGALFLRWNRNVNLPAGEGPAPLIALLVLATLLSICSVALPYLARLGLPGADRGTAALRTPQLLTAAPYVVLLGGFAVADVLGAVYQFGRLPPQSPGVGPGIWWGVVATILATQRRAAVDAGRSRRWLAVVRPAMWVAACLSLLSGLFSLLALAVDSARNSSAPTTTGQAIIVLLTSMLACTLAGVVATGVGADFPAWRLTVAACGSTVLITGAIMTQSQSGGVEQFGSSRYFATTAWCVAAGVALVAGGAPFAPDSPTHAGYIWLAACRNALGIVGLWMLIDAAVSVITAIVWSLDIVAAVVSAALAASTAVVAGIGARRMRPRYNRAQDPRPSREVTLCVCCVIVALTLVRLTVNAGTSLHRSTVPMDLAIPGLAVAVALAIAAASPVRKLYAGIPLRGTLSQRARQALLPSALPEAGDDEDKAATMNPYTSQAQLARIAQHRTDLRALVAAHPHTDAGLLDWLAAQQDPDVTRAIEQRNSGQI
ncbi:hypothetical protein [Rhodococcus sp. IEGM 1307]|uniref:DUF7937 domain-containing protein n=1 Tax=Rhodococcus sp. IEGM 1307 TaxID=3047091 RepID=UPI0024B6E02D|nr:hypothetical protein [Rhodococcus sp. IEGM 1307]MDI9978750.1 hypothetical protein [Rhodococcus sp. IEGM 1307]